MTSPDGLLSASPDISCPVIFGNGKFLCGVLVKPPAEYPLDANDEAARNEYLAKVWSYIDSHVNHVVPRHSRILRPLVLMEHPSKPFQLTDKRTVKKKATLELYREEIEQAYQIVEQGELGSIGIEAPAFSDIESITSFVRALVSRSLGRDIGDDDDFFNSGLDSLLSVKLRFSIISALKANDRPPVNIPRNVVYTHSTTSRLARYLWSVTNVEHDKADEQAEDDARSLVDEVVNQLTSNFPERPSVLEAPTTGGDVYILTGTTGSLGSAFVSTLLHQPAHVVKKVYLLNRASSKASILERHRSSFMERGLDFSILETSVASGRAVAIEMDVSAERLGIDADTYAEVILSPDSVIGSILTSFPLTSCRLRPHISYTLPGQSPSRIISDRSSHSFGDFAISST